MKSVTISQDPSGKYYADVLFMYENQIPEQAEQMSLKHFIMEVCMKKSMLFLGILMFLSILFISCKKSPAKVINSSQKKDAPVKQEKSVLSGQTEDVDKTSEKQQEDENQEQTYAIVKELGFHYKETTLPFHTEDYYYDGIWETVLDTDGTLIAYGRNDKTGQGNLLSWADGKQMQIPFPSNKHASKKWKTGSMKIVPCSYGEENGYVLYQKNPKQQKYLCYVLDKKGKIKKQIPLQKYLDQEIKEDCYEIQGIRQTEKNKVSVMVSAYNQTLYRQFHGILSQWDTFYVLEIDIIKKELSFVGKYGYWVLGTDEKNVYGIDFNQTYDFYNFQYGNSYIENKRTKEIIDFSEIPNDAVTLVNDCVSQYFDIKNGVIYLANRTGVYRKREDKKYVWERLMKPEDSTYLNEGYTLTDITIVNENQFYLMFLKGDDDETATVLAQYDRS